MSTISCVTCKEIVTDDSDYLICTGQYGGTFHPLCGGLTEAAFKKLSTSKEFKWMCAACIFLNI